MQLVERGFIHQIRTSMEDDTFTVTVTDDDGNAESQVISVTVNAVNDAALFGGDTTGTGI